MRVVFLLLEPTKVYKQRKKVAENVEPICFWSLLFKVHGMLLCRYIWLHINVGPHSNDLSRRPPQKGCRIVLECIIKKKNCMSVCVCEHVFVSSGFYFSFKIYFFETRYFWLLLLRFETMHVSSMNIESHFSLSWTWARSKSLSSYLICYTLLK